MSRPPSKRAAGLAAIVAVLIPLVAVLLGESIGAESPDGDDPSGEDAIVFEPGAEPGGGGFRQTTLADLARRDEVVVTARATRAEQVAGGPDGAAYTRQTFVRGETLAGQVERRFIVRFFGGPVRTPDAVIPADPEDPQFESGTSYLLVLDRRAGGEWSIVGPAAGRYEVGRSGLEPVGSGPAQSALGGLSPQQAAGRIARAQAGS
ncbi:hypothetical protein HJD18_05980 [Thermoleophilia bacterium SCSIO 60948]|nr:hypothetical protein HJD18_05980 [Thermoleophilia bacterium SCSIO 60948]